MISKNPANPINAISVALQKCNRFLRAGSMSFVFILFLKDSTFSQQGQKQIIMAVFAHADDELDVSPLLARYAREGHAVYLVFATKGELGVRKHANIPGGDSLARARAIEAACACNALGIKDPLFLELGDGSLAKDFTGVPLRKKLDSLFNLYKPNVVVTWGPEGGYGHMDHRVVHNVVTELFQSGTNAYPQRLYYSGIPTELMKTLPQLKAQMSNFLVQYWKPVKKDYLSVRVPFTPQDGERAMASLSCYTSQFTPEELEDNRVMLTHTRKDTVYLRPFLPRMKVSHDIFEITKWKR